MTELPDGSVKCAAKYCRSLAKPGKKYCGKHEIMTGGEMIREIRGPSAYVLTVKQAQMLIDYAIARLTEDEP